MARCRPLALRSCGSGRTTVTWDVAPESDPEIAAGLQKITVRVLGSTDPGSILLLHPMHDGGKATREAIRPIIRGPKREGSRFVTVSELLKDAARE